MSADFVARGLATAESARNKRLRILNTLRASIARAGMVPRPLAASLPTINAAGTATTAIATGATWTPMAYPGRFSWLGGSWGIQGATYPLNQVWGATVLHYGDGANPAAAAGRVSGSRVRFACAAPMFEIFARYSNAVNGFRLKVDGDYVYTGLLGAVDAQNGNLRFIPVQWGDGTATFRKLRHYELEFGAAGEFGGIRTANLYEPQAWEPADRLRVLVHADSMTSTIQDSANQGTALLGNAGNLLADTLGQPDCWHSSVGGTGFYNDMGGLRSTFLERLSLDVIAPAPDVILEMGGKNDGLFIPGTITQAQFQAMVESWLAQVIAAKPETIVFMTGPIISTGPEAATATSLAVRNAKQAAAAKWPRNVAFIDNLAAPWVTGNGRVGAANGSGSADWINGTDTTHPSIEGHQWMATSMTRAVAAAIPALIAAQ